MAERDAKRIDTNTPEMDHLLQIYGMGTATHVSEILVLIERLNLCSEIFLLGDVLVTKSLVSVRRLSVMHTVRTGLRKMLSNFFFVLIQTVTRCLTQLQRYHQHPSPPPPKFGTFFQKFKTPS